MNVSLSISFALWLTATTSAAAMHHHSYHHLSFVRSSYHLRHRDVISAKAFTSFNGNRQYARPAKFTLSTADVPVENSPNEVKTIFNIVKNVAGSGMLTLPMGLALASQAKGAVTTGLIILTMLAALSAYCFDLIGQLCHKNQASSYKEIWEKAVDKSTAWVPASSCMAKCFISCLSYLMVMGDALSSILAGTPLPLWCKHRTSVIVGMTAAVLFPLCNLPDLSSLGNVSILGVLCIVYTAIVMGVRFFDGTYQLGGQLAQTLPIDSLPSFGAGEGLISGINPSIFVLVSMLSTAFIAHYNSPQFYKELEPAQGGDKLSSFRKVVWLAYGASAFLSAFIMGCGFLTFGGNSMGFILNNYAAKDKLITVARSMMSLSMIASFPLVFVGMRVGILELLNITKPSSKLQLTTTVALLSILVALAVSLKDLGVLLSYSGAILGSLVIYILPAIMAISTNRNMATSSTMSRRSNVRHWLLISLGTTLAAIGTVVTALKG